MSCIIEKRSENSSEELMSIFNNENTVLGILQANNGYPLSKDRLGNDSQLFQDLLDNATREQALIAKSLLATKNYIVEPTILEFKNMVNNPMVDKIVENYAVKNNKELLDENINPEKSNELNDEQLDKSMISFEFEAEKVTKTPKNFTSFKKFKQHQLNTYRQNLIVAKNRKNVAMASNNNEKFEEIIKEVTRLEYMIKEVESQLKDFSSLMDIDSPIDLILKFVNQDLKRINDLIINKNPLAYTEGTELLNWYKKLGNFSIEEHHPFFRDNVTIFEKNNLTPEEEKTKKGLRDITDKATRLQDKINMMTKNLILDMLVKHRHAEKLDTQVKGELDIQSMTIEKLFESEEIDIDVFSRWLRNPNKSFGRLFGVEYSKNYVAQLMLEYFERVISEGEQQISRLANKIDNAVIDLNLENFDAFRQEDKNGNQTAKLVNKFTNEWFEHIDNIFDELHDAKGRILTSGTTNYDIAYSEHHKKLMEKADYIDIMFLPELQEFDKELGTKYKNNFDANSDKAIEYVKKLKERLGEQGYKDIVEMQKKEYKNYIDNMHSLKMDLTFEVHNGTMTTKEMNQKMHTFYIQNNPFFVKYANPDTGVVSMGKGGTVTGTYNMLVPKEAYKDEFIDKRFEAIESNPKMYELWQAFNEALLYINSVVATTGNANNLTFNSLMDMGDSMLEHITWKGIFFGNDFLKLHEKISDKWKNIATVNTEDLTTKGKNKKNASKYGKRRNDKDINTSELRSVQGKADSKTRQIMKIILPVNKEKNKNLRDVEIEIDDEIVLILKDVLNEKTFNTFMRALRTKKVKYKYIENLINKEMVKEIMANQTMDLAKVIKHFLVHAVDADARNKALPLLNIMQKLHNEQLTPEGEERSRSNSRLDDWKKRVVQNKRSSTGFMTSLDYRLYTKEEKKALKLIKKRIRQLNEDATRGEIEALNRELNKLGNPFSFKFVGKTIQTTMLYLYLMFSPIAGYFNRIQGINSNDFLDRLGTHWTKGNDIFSVAFMKQKKYMPLFKLLQKFGIGNGGAEMKKAILFFDMIRLHQDLRDISQKASRKLGKEDWKKKFHPLFLAITKPEWLNQGQTFLNVLQDQYVEDNNGKKFQVFDGNRFVIYKNIDSDGVEYGQKKKNGKRSEGGTLILKDEFRYNKDGSENKKNIENWENLGPGEFTDFKIEARSANTEAAGDYDPRTGISAKDDDAFWGMGKYAMTFSGWAGSIVGLRIDRGVNLATGTVRKHSPMHSLNATQMILYSSSLAFLFAGAGLFGTAAGISAMAMGAGMLGTRMFKKDIVMNVNIFKELYGTLKLLTLTMIGIPTRRFLKKDINIPAEQYFKVDEETANAMRAIASDMSKVLYIIAATIGAARIYQCDEYDTIRDCAKKTAKKNWIVNMVYRFADDILFAYSPARMVEQITSGSFLLFLLKNGDMIYNIVKAIVDDEPEVYLSGTNQGRTKWSERTANVFMPSILKQIGVFENRGNYSNDISSSLGLDNSVPGTNVSWIGEPSLSVNDYSGLYFTKPYLTAEEEEKEKMRELKKNKRMWNEYRRKELENLGYSDYEIKNALED